MLITMPGVRLTGTSPDYHKRLGIPRASDRRRSELSRRPSHRQKQQSRAWSLADHRGYAPRGIAHAGFAPLLAAARP